MAEGNRDPALVNEVVGVSHRDFERDADGLAGITCDRHLRSGSASPEGRRACENPLVASAPSVIAGSLYSAEPVAIVAQTRRRCP